MTRRRAFRSRRVVTGERGRPMGAADVVIDGDRIAEVTEHGAHGPEAEDVGDAVVMPALLDVHVHVNEPGRGDWEGFETATRAAAAGGIGVLFDMPLNSEPVTTSVPAFDQKVESARGRCRCDVGLYGGLVPESCRPERIEELSAAGVFAWKAFLCDSGLSTFPPVGAEHLRSAMTRLADWSLPLLVHAEIIRGGPPSAGGHRQHRRSRPPSCELEAIELLIELCRETGCRVHVVHLAAADALPALAAARRQGLPISVETCPHYLSFCAEEIPDHDPRYKCAPPIRDRENRERLWGGLADGVIDLVASDHSPCPPALKSPSGLDSGEAFQAAWGGIASLQLLLPALWTAARDRGFGLEEIAGWLCREPARLMGLAEQRGVLAPGLSADLVIWHPERSFVVDPERLEHRHPVTPYEGRELYGTVARTWSRGREIYRAADGDPGQDRFPGPPAGEILLRRPTPKWQLEALGERQLRELLTACCGAERWVEEMLSKRPYRDLDSLLEVAERSFDQLGERDWLEAFAAHPRIGGLGNDRAESSGGGAFARREQSGAAGAPPDVLAELARGNRLYEERFGFVYLVFATGKSATEMLDILRRRLRSSREQELAAAAGEQRKITRLRLRELAEATPPQASRPSRPPLPRASEP